MGREYEAAAETLLNRLRAVEENGGLNELELYRLIRDARALAVVLPQRAVPITRLRKIAGTRIFEGRLADRIADLLIA